VPTGYGELTTPTSRQLRAIDLLRMACHRWLVVLLFGLIGLTGAVALYLNSTRWYVAEIMIVPKSSGNGVGMMPALLGGGPLGIAEPETNRIDCLLHSRSVTDAIIDRFHLVQRYQVGTVEGARLRLWSSCSTVVDKKQKVVRLLCEDEDPAAAVEMTEAFAQLTDRGLRRVAQASAGEERGFLQGRLLGAERDLDESSQALRRFQEGHAILDPEAQAKALILALASLESELASRRLELSSATTFASDGAMSIVKLRRQIGAIGAELRALEDRRGAPLGGSRRAVTSVFPSARLVPGLRAEWDALLRDHTVQTRVVGGLIARYEGLMLEEARDLSSFVVFDHAVLPTRHVRPTLRMLPPGLLAGLLLGVLFISRHVWRTNRASRHIDRPRPQGH